MSAGNIKNQIKQIYKQNTPISGQDVRDTAGDATETAHPDGSRDEYHGADSGVDAAAGVQSGIGTLKDRGSDNVDDDTKNRVTDTKNTTQERTKNYLKQKMPEERRDQAIWRLKKMVVEIQGHPDCKILSPNFLSS
jgi:hypothetical protein